MKTFRPVTSVAVLALSLTTAACGEVVDDGDGAATTDVITEGQDELFVLSTVIWNNRTVPVCWETAGSDTEKAWVRAAVARTWEAESQLFFAWADSCPSGFGGIRIRISDEGPHTKGLGTRLAGVSAGMVLNFSFNNWGPACRSQRQNCIDSIAVHEFGHAIGFAHEQNRSDRPSNCTEPRSGTYGNVTVGAWDLSSVMNACNPNLINFGALSATDVTGVQRFYGGRKRADFRSRIVVGTGSWGTWSDFQYCAPTSWAKTYSLRVERAQGSGDDTALNALAIDCSDRGPVVVKNTLVPHSGYWGNWYAGATCRFGHMITAKMRIEGSQGNGDDSGANDVQFDCNDGSSLAAPGGGTWGTWRASQTCPADTVVCGASVRVETPRGSGDDTAMNGLQLECCAY